MKSGPGPASETDVSDCLSGFTRRRSFEKAIYFDLSTNAPFPSPGGAFSRPAPQRLIKVGRLILALFEKTST
jgi:hypothetical protein